MNFQRNLKLHKVESGVRKPDFIQSSDFTNLRPPRVPSYMKDEPNMYHLLSMEYARLWFKEKESRENILFADVDPRSGCILYRKFVKRGLLLLKHKQEQCKPRFIINKFRNVPSKMVEQRPKEQEKKGKEEITSSFNVKYPLSL